GEIKQKRYNISTNMWHITAIDFGKLEVLDKKLFPVKKPVVATPVAAQNRPEKKFLTLKEKMANVIKYESKEVNGYDNIGKHMKLQPYKYQKKIIKFGLDTGNALIVAPCGSGKTPCGIGLYDEALRGGKIKGPGVIVVKASLKVQWAAEVRKFTDYRPMIIKTSKEVMQPFNYKIKRLEKLVDKATTVAERARAVKNVAEAKKKAEEAFDAQFENVDLFIVNYETLKDGMVRKKLHAMKIEYIFADEVHYIKSWTTDRAKALCEFNDVKMKFGATATPLQRDPRDLYGIFKFVEPSIFPSQRVFEVNFIKWARRGIVSSCKNEKLLNDSISPNMIIIPKEEVAKQLPSIVVSQRYCDFDPKQQEINDQLMMELDELHEQEKKFESLTEAEARNCEDLKNIQAGILARQTYAQELADSEQLLKMSDSESSKKYITKKPDNKMLLLMDTLEEILESGEKVCIFSRYVRMQKIIEDLVTKAGEKNATFKDVKIAFVNSSLSSEKRYDEVYNKFRDNDDYKILVMSDAGAEGFNLTRCKFLIEVEAAESYAIQTQRHGRLERADSIHDTVFVIQLVMNNSWDEIARRIISKKEAYDTRLVKGLGLETA
ncbi:MAG: DEAD/DEAH box helicase, partial [Butyrivibrio sp.]|nr:DEAD/DEAH box helicase [Butyrivibrio sp.]